MPLRNKYSLTIIMLKIALTALISIVTVDMVKDVVRVYNTRKTEIDYIDYSENDVAELPAVGFTIKPDSLKLVKQ